MPMDWQKYNPIGGAMVGGIFGGNNSKSIPVEEKLFGFGNTHQREAENEQKRLRDEWKVKGDEIEGTRSAADDSFLSQMQGNVAGAKSDMSALGRGRDADLDSLKEEIGNSQKDTRATYTNTIQPRMKDQMEKAQKNASGAMTLQEAMDPNNSVAQGTRKLYETQAQNEGRQGLADTGMLQAMGMQSMAGQMGGMPMTGGQMQALMGANQSQAGAAFANTQRRMQSLRDQGLDRGFERSDAAYTNGLDAQDRYRRSVGDYEGAAGRQDAADARYRGEWNDVSQQRYDTGMDYDQNMFNLDSGMSGLQHGLSTGKSARDEARANRFYGGGIQQQIGKANRADAQNEGKQRMLTGGIGALSGLMGGGGGGGGGGSGHGSTGYSPREQEQQPMDEYGDDGQVNYDFGSEGGENVSGPGREQDPNAQYTEDMSGIALTDQMQPEYRGRGYPRRRYA